MDSFEDFLTEVQSFEDFLARARVEANVLGVVLSGSQAREGAATAHSDHDVYLIVADGAVAVRRRDAVLDVVVMTLEEFRAHALPDTDTEWNRYSFVHSKVLKDDAGIAELVAVKSTLSPEEAASVARWNLDAFLNSTYRCLKNDRDGNPVGALLDGSEAVPHYLTYVFALHGRVRPYNKYLAWELRHHPLSHPLWAHDRLLPQLASAVSSEAPEAVRRLLNDLEPHARAAGHGDVLEGWGQDLRFMLSG